MFHSVQNALCSVLLCVRERERNAGSNKNEKRGSSGKEKADESEKRNIIFW